LTLANGTQENAAATGDLDITSSLHSLTIAGGGPVAKVTVPKSQNGNPAVDDGPQYTVNGCP
jgi:hypothetical protein